MKQENDQIHTILDAEYEVINEEKNVSGATQKGVAVTALILAGLGLAALPFRKNRLSHGSRCGNNRMLTLGMIESIYTTAQERQVFQ